MRRIFLSTAIVVGTLLVVTFGLGLVAATEDRRLGHQWRDVHFLLGLLTTVAVLFIHSIVYTHLLGSGKWVKEVARVYQLPDWVAAQAKRNKRRAFPFLFWSMMLVGVAAWLGAASDTRRDFNPLWHLAASALAIGFNLGAFLIEHASITAQERLVLEVKEQADRLRAAQLVGDPPA